MKIAILELAPSRADPILESIRSIGESNLELVILAAHAGACLLPADAAGLVGSGGPGSVASLHSLDAMTTVHRQGFRILSEAVSHGVPTLGICMSHQLLAAGFGGRVGARPDGLFVGFEKVRQLIVEDPLWGKLPPAVTLAQFHHDEVLAPPLGWEATAESDSCRIEAMRWPGRAVWSFQGHPELPADYVRCRATASQLSVVGSEGEKYDALRLQIFTNFLRVVRQVAAKVK